MADDFARIPNLKRFLSARSIEVEQIAQKLLRFARINAPNEHIRRSISVHKISDNSKGNLSITLRARAKDARAYEYGSGIHARRKKTSKHQQGPRGKILIEAKNAPYLVFPWQEKLVKKKSVLHPGVEAANSGEGYLRKAFKDVRREIRQDLRKGIVRAVRADIKAILLFGNKK